MAKSPEKTGEPASQASEAAENTENTEGAGAATAGPWLLAVGGMGGGLGHRRSAGLGTAHDHPKAPLRGATESS